MNVTYSARIQQNSDDFPLLQKASAQLVEVLGRAVDAVSVHWDIQEDDEGRLVYVLTLKHVTDEVSGRIAPDELRSLNQLRFRLYLLWGNLLHAMNRHRIDRMVRAED